MKIRVEKRKIYNNKDEVVSNGQFKIEFEKAHRNVILKALSKLYKFDTDRVLYKLYHNVDWNDIMDKYYKIVNDKDNEYNLQEDIPIEVCKIELQGFKMHLFCTADTFSMKLKYKDYTVFLDFPIDDIIEDLGNEQYEGHITIRSMLGQGISIYRTKNNNRKLNRLDSIFKKGTIDEILEEVTKQLDIKYIALYFPFTMFEYGFGHFYTIRYDMQYLKGYDIIDCEDCEIPIGYIYRQLQSLGYKINEEIDLKDVNTSLDSAKAQILWNNSLLLSTLEYDFGEGY